MVHNIDTLGADVDAGAAGLPHRAGRGADCEVIARHLEDRGGGLARVDGRLRLVEGLALPREEVESRLSYYNSATYWIDIDQLLAVFGLCPRRPDQPGTARAPRSARWPPACPPTSP